MKASRSMRPGSAAYAPAPVRPVKYLSKRRLMMPCWARTSAIRASVRGFTSSAGTSPLRSVAPAAGKQQGRGEPLHLAVRGDTQRPVGSSAVNVETYLPVGPGYRGGHYGRHVKLLPIPPDPHTSWAENRGSRRAREAGRGRPGGGRRRWLALAGSVRDPGGPRGRSA